MIDTQKLGPTGGRRGSAMIGVLMVLFALMGLSLSMLEFGASRLREQGQRAEDLRSFFLAESALSEAIHAVRLGGDGTIASRALPAMLGGGLVWTTVVLRADDTIEITARGLTGSGRAAVRAVLGPLPDTPFIAGLFSDSQFTLENNATVDGWDSSLGTTYEQQVDAGLADGFVTIASNDDITLNASSLMMGDVRPGPTGTFWKASNAVVTGTILPLPRVLKLPPIVTPSIPMTGSPDAYGEYAKVIPSSSTTVLPPGQYHWDSLLVENSTTFTIEGPATLVVGTVTMNSSVILNLDTTNGPIQLYTPGDLAFSSNTTINTLSGTPRDVEFYLTGDEYQVASFASNSEFYGTLYGPQATVTIGSNYELFGAVSSRVVILESNSMLHYDSTLKFSAGLLLTGMQLHFWAPIRFPEADLLIDRADAFVVMGVSRSDLMSMTEHQEILTAQKNYPPPQ